MSTRLFGNTFPTPIELASTGRPDVGESLVCTEFAAAAAGEALLPA
jgi:hypothetical protein